MVSIFLNLFCNIVVPCNRSSATQKPRPPRLQISEDSPLGTVTRNFPRSQQTESRPHQIRTGRNSLNADKSTPTRTTTTRKQIKANSNNQKATHGRSVQITTLVGRSKQITTTRVQIKRNRNNQKPDLGSSNNQSADKGRWQQSKGRDQGRPQQPESREQGKSGQIGTGHNKQKAPTRSFGSQRFSNKYTASGKGNITTTREERIATTRGQMKPNQQNQTASQGRSQEPESRSRQIATTRKIKADRNDLKPDKCRS